MENNLEAAYEPNTFETPESHIDHLRDAIQQLFPHFSAMHIPDEVKENLRKVYAASNPSDYEWRLMHLKQQNDHLRSEITRLKLRNLGTVRTLINIQALVHPGSFMSPSGEEIAFDPPDENVRYAWKALSEAIRNVTVWDVSEDL